MEKLKQSQEIISLGKKLVKELSYDDRCDLRTRWMGHYLAECITKAENEPDEKKKGQLEKKCCDIILQLWKNRKHLPGNAKPLASLGDSLTVLTALLAKEKDIDSWEIYTHERHETGWGKFMKETSKKFNKILAISLYATLGDDTLSREKEWLAHKELLSENERSIIEQLDQLLTSNESYIRIILSDEYNKDDNETAENKSRMEQAVDKIQAHIDSLGKILEELKKEKLSIKKKRR